MLSPNRLAHGASAAVIMIVVALGASCGARSALPGDDEMADVAAGAGGALNHTTGASGSSCTDGVCDDGLACTVDVCDQGVCRHEPCDSLCDDGIFCDGVERCDSAVGCIDGPQACEPGLGCSQGTCGEDDETCSYTLPSGCTPPDVQLLLVDNSGTLFRINPYLQDPPVLVGQASTVVTLDVAVRDDRWFAVNGSSLIELDPTTGEKSTVVGSLRGNSLAAGPDGFLYAADDTVRRMHPDTGVVDVIGPLPAGLESSGDIAFVADRMFVSVTGECGGAMVEVDVVTGDAQVIGGDGLGCVFGLAPANDELFLINCDGTIGIFDPETGQARIFSRTVTNIYGADRLP